MFRQRSQLSPLHLLDYRLIILGRAAMVLTTADQARDTRPLSLDFCSVGQVAPLQRAGRPPKRSVGVTHAGLDSKRPKFLMCLHRRTDVGSLRSANRGLPRLTMAFAFSDQATLAPPRLADAIFSKMCRQSASQ
jgi:hypothetical protein